MKLYEKYLQIKEARNGGMMTPEKKAAMAKVIKVIRSTKTPEQLEVARKMGARFMKLYGDDWKVELDKEMTALPLTGKTYDKVFGTYRDQKERLAYLKNIMK